MKNAQTLAEELRKLIKDTVSDLQLALDALADAEALAEKKEKAVMVIVNGKLHHVWHCLHFNHRVFDVDASDAKLRELVAAALAREGTQK